VQSQFWLPRKTAANRLDTVNRGRYFRKRATEPERVLWRHLRNRNFAGYKFRRQHPIDRFTVDLYCPAAKLAVEIDGSGHGYLLRENYDRARDEFLASIGISVFRFWNHQVRQELDSVLGAIWFALEGRSRKNPSPPSSPFGKGRGVQKRRGIHTRALAGSRRNFVNRMNHRASSFIGSHLPALLSFVFLFLVPIVRADPAHARQPKIWEEFSGEKAFAHVQRLVDLGPRPPGSEAIEKSRDYIEDQLRRSGWQVTRQPFSDDTPRGKVQFVNLIAKFATQGNAASSFLLCSHYDTKTFDTIRFVGANDGGSSTGLLLELARVIAQHPNLAAKIELVFFDGEEAYEHFSDKDGLYGSRYFARQLQGGAKQFRGGILFDMVGDRSLDITLPADSPAEMARDIFAAAEALKLRSYFTYLDREMTDDHTPLNAIGIPMIDVIDFDYPWWHTADDTIDKISPRSLQIVGTVALYYLSEFALK
jgi:glutaminyl-peptide cyclotransferase